METAATSTCWSRRGWYSVIADERATTAHHGFHGSENRSPGSSSAPTPPCSTSPGDALGNGTSQAPEVVHTKDRPGSLGWSRERARSGSVKSDGDLNW